MRLFKRCFSFVAALLVSLSSLLVFLVPQAHAVAVTRTWTGGGADTNMTTVGNWGGTAPLAGDDLVFPANITNRTVVNDYTAATSFNSITFSGVVSTLSNYVISGNAFVVAGGISSSMTSGQSGQEISANITLSSAQTISIEDPGALTLSGTVSIGTSAIGLGGTGNIYIEGVVSGSGTITKTGVGSTELYGASSGYTGAVLVSAGTLTVSNLAALGTSAGATTVSSGAAMYLCLGNVDATLAEPVTLSGTGISSNGALRAFASCGSNSSNTGKAYTLSGAVTLGADAVFNGYNIGLTVTGTYTSNGHTFTPKDGSNGVLTLPSGVVSAAELVTTYAANAPSTSIFVETNNVSIVTGTYSTAYVQGGTLKGTGTLGIINLLSGIVAPGMSPGCLNAAGLAFTGGTYQAELGGTIACTGYDQLKVTGTVDLGTATTLTTSLYGGFKPAAGNTFTIIDNDLADAVTGTFTGMAEGATFTVDGYVFKISYVGGDGNDVVLTTVSVPAVPDTGFKLLTSSPIAIMAATLAITAGAYVISKRYATAKTK